MKKVCLLLCFFIVIFLFSCSSNTNTKKYNVDYISGNISFKSCDECVAFLEQKLIIYNENYGFAKWNNNMKVLSISKSFCENIVYTISYNFPVQDENCYLRDSTYLYFNLSCFPSNIHNIKDTYISVKFEKNSEKYIIYFKTPNRYDAIVDDYSIYLIDNDSDKILKTITLDDFCLLYSDFEINEIDVKVGRSITEI